MSSNGNIKFKFRIVVGSDPSYPYIVQEKGWFFWHKNSIHRSIDSANEHVQSEAKLAVMRPGTVIYEYCEKDYLVDKLKGNS